MFGRGYLHCQNTAQVLNNGNSNSFTWLKGNVPFQGSGGAAWYSNPDWRQAPSTAVARHQMFKIIWKSLPPVQGELLSEVAARHVVEMERELFRQSNSLADYLNTATIFYRLLVINQLKAQHDCIMMSNHCGTPAAEGSHLSPPNFGSTSSFGGARDDFQQTNLVQQSEASARKYRRGISGRIIVREQEAPPPSLATAPAEYLVSPVHSSSRVPSLNISAINDAQAIPLDGNRPRYGLPFDENSSGGASIFQPQVNSAEQSGASGRKYQRGVHGRVITHEHEAPSPSPATALGQYLASPVLSSSGTIYNPPPSPNIGAIHNAWATPIDRKKPRFGLPIVDSSGGVSGTKYQRGIHGRVITRDCEHEVPPPSPASFPANFRVACVGASGRSSTFCNPPPRNNDSAINDGWAIPPDSQQAGHGLPFGNQSSGAPGRKYLQGIQDGIIMHDCQAPPPSLDVAGVKDLASPGGTSCDSSILIDSPGSPIISTVNGGGFDLQDGEQTRHGLPFGNNSSEGSVVHQINSTDLLKKQEWASKRLPRLQQLSKSSPSTNSPVPSKSDIRNLVNDLMDDNFKSNLEVRSVPLGEVLVISTSPDSSLTDDLEPCAPAKEIMNCTEVENTIMQVSESQENNTRENEILAAKDSSSESAKTENTDVSCVALTEFLSRERILEHLSSLRSGINEGDVEKEATDASSENTCRLCGEEKLFFEPSPCSFCWTSIRKNTVYYSPSVESDLKLCRPCYDNCGRKAKYGEKTFNKEELRKKNINKGLEEDWVQCDECKGWQHQICTLYNQERDKEGKANYTCPYCCLREIETGERLPVNVRAFNAKNLPRTALSDHIERRLSTSLKEDRENRASNAGKSFLEVPGVEDLTVRVVLTEKMNLKVNKEILDLFHQTDYPSEFPYDSKMILLFQKIGAVDVILFGFYVQEYGSNCGHPNQRCVYISYLDSVKYFKPEISSATGEALRTFAYHEILIGYLDYCKQQGFVSCYIWACPPRKGQDYLFYHHPGNQKNPIPSKLRKWYQSMIHKAMEEKIVVSRSNLYEYHFCSSSDSRYQVSATRLPYFEGDCWPSCAENVLKQVDREVKSNNQRKRATIGPKSNPKATRSANALDNSKESLFMQKLGNIIQPDKKDFIVVHLRHVCTHCHHAIASGKGWFCGGCTDFRLCERCHHNESDLAESHRLRRGEEHLLSKVLVDSLPPSTENGEGTMENCLFRSRLTFLKFCQQRNYQFNTLRRAKHSSMMFLHFLHHRTDLSECSICANAFPSEECWTCESCPNFRVCSSCRKHQDFSHSHALTRGSAAEMELDHQ